ncbi:MAG: hypothetical protein ACRECH_12270 [Nitrososphaerales archaeon]
MTLDQVTGKEQSPLAVSRRLKQEVDSWRPYAEALRQEDRDVFREMMNDVARAYGEAVDLAERGYDTEAVMMSILLSQQKTINWLSNLARALREEKKSP